MCACMYICVYACVYAIVCVSSLDHSLRESFLFFHCVDPQGTNSNCSQAWQLAKPFLR